MKFYRLQMSDSRCQIADKEISLIFNPQSTICNLKTGLVIGVIVFLMVFQVLAEDSAGSEIIKRDPFIPLVTKTGKILIAKDETAVSNLILKGIIYSQDKSLAIINDDVFSEGDQIGGYIILEIEEKKVILIKDEEEVVLELEE